MAIPDVELSAVSSFAIWFQIFSSQTAPTSLVQEVRSLRGYRVGLGLFLEEGALPIDLFRY